MLFTLICKKRTTEDGKKWTNYSLLKDKKWYSVKFVKDCAPPQNHKIDENIFRAFIELTNNDVFDLKEGEYPTLFVEKYTAPAPETVEKYIGIEKKNIQKFREKKDQAKKDFIMPTDEELPF